MKTNVITCRHKLNVFFRRWKDSAGAFLAWGPISIPFCLPSLQETTVKRRAMQTQNPSSEGSHPFSAVISTSEKETIKGALSRVCGESIFPAAGAGYKSLCVSSASLSTFTSSHEDTTLKWDSCAAHAILRAMGGGMVDLKECLERNPDS